METDVILRAVLYNALKGKSLSQVQRSIKAICPKDMIAAIEKQVAEDLLAEEQEAADNC
ncbi:MAG: hypothetical protein FWE20_05660 [Defluviitaleaceae bacterium]|nr:hypothetical protein [Defluviitaleaceae bacterium]